MFPSIDNEATASKRFIVGLSIIQKYWKPDTIISVCEQSSICVQGLNPFFDEELLQLKDLGWDATIINHETGIAYFHGLEYSDY